MFQGSRNLTTTAVSPVCWASKAAIRLATALPCWERFTTWAPDCWRWRTPVTHLGEPLSNHGPIKCTCVLNNVCPMNGFVLNAPIILMVLFFLITCIQIKIGCKSLWREMFSNSFWKCLLMRKSGCLMEGHSTVSDQQLRNSCPWKFFSLCVSHHNIRYTRR